MIRYCLGAVFLVACSGVGTVKDPPEISQGAVTKPVPEYVKPVRTKHTHQRCDVTFENKRVEILYKMECLAEGTGGA